MKLRFTFQYVNHSLFLNTFHQSQRMQTNSAVLYLFTVNLYQAHVSIVPYLLLNDGGVQISEIKQNFVLILCTAYNKVW